ncbi:hypothetical protein K2X85_14900 [bacterium]|nr:hypothetical protein [bacterium]
MHLWLALAILTADSATPSPELGELVKSIIIAAGPLKVEERPGWGDQASVFDGWKVEGQGFKARFHERKKRVNHGLWQHYRLQLKDPAHDLQIRFPRLQYVPERGVEFTIDARAKLDAYANVQQHANGVQLFAVGTEGVVEVRAQLAGVVAVKVDAQSGSLELLLSPRIEKVDLGVTNIDIDRFGKLRGKIVHEAGDSFRRLIDDLLNDKDDKVVADINRDIEKKWNDGTLRVPLMLELSRAFPPVAVNLP